MVRVLRQHFLDAFPGVISPAHVAQGPRELDFVIGLPRL